MAKRRGLEPSHDDHVNVTPLIDIVMCLIIFFMICGKLVQGEIEGAITVPKAKRAEEIDQKNRLVVNIVPVYQNPPIAGTPIEKQIVNVKYVVNKVEIDNFADPKALTDFLRKAKAADPDLRLLIRADREIPYPLISPVIVSCAQADIKSMHFATERE